MSQDTLILEGSLSIVPIAVPAGQAQGVTNPLAERQYWKHRADGSGFDLAADAPVALPFGAVVNATFIYIRAVGGKVRVRLTSADGSQQSVPCDPTLMLFCSSVPVTAIDITRVSGIATSITYLLGENA